MSSIINKILNEAILVEGPALDYLNQEADFSGSGWRKDFVLWQKSKAKTVEIVSYKTLDIANKIDKHLIRFKPKQKDCFTTAYYAADNITGVDYVEGRGSFKGIPFINHGFNCYKGQYFDLTAEVLFNNDMFEDQIAIIQLNNMKIIDLANDLGYAGPFLMAYYFKYVLKQWDEKTIEKCIAMM